MVGKDVTNHLESYHADPSLHAEVQLGVRIVWRIAPMDAKQELKRGTSIQVSECKSALLNTERHLLFFKRPYLFSSQGLTRHTNSGGRLFYFL